MFANHRLTQLYYNHYTVFNMSCMVLIKHVVFLMQEEIVQTKRIKESIK